MATRQESIDQIRRFNRHYVPIMRLLDRSYLDTGMPTLEVAALLEIGENDGCSARDIVSLLHMDKGYLSRTIRRFENEGLVSRAVSEEDARVQLLSLTQAGRAYVDKLKVAGQDIVAKAFDEVDDERLAEAASDLTRVLGIMGRGEGA